MKVLAPIEGVVDWRVEPFAQVKPGTVLGWIAGPGRCGLIPLTAGEAGTINWRRTSALESIAQGEPAALIDGDSEELNECLQAEGNAISRVVAALEAEVLQLEADERAHPLRIELLRPQRKGLEARLSVLRSLGERTQPR